MIEIKAQCILFSKNLIYKFRMRTWAIFTGLVLLCVFFLYDLELIIDIYHGVCVMTPYQPPPPSPPPPNITMTFLVVKSICDALLKHCFLAGQGRIKLNKAYLCLRLVGASGIN